MLKELETHQLLEVVDISSFIYAGNATFTLENVKTGKRYTYKVQQKDNQKLWFFSLLTGSDNTKDYTYIGYCRSISANQIYTKAGSGFSDSAPSVTALNWLLNHLQTCIKTTQRFNENAAFYHAGKCCRCGRKLTTPESVTAGIGPECATKR